MSSNLSAIQFLTQEAKSMLNRLGVVKPFVLQQPAVTAAHIPAYASNAIERYLARSRHGLRDLIHGYLKWLHDPKDPPNPAEAQRRYAIVRLKFNAVLTQFDVFADVLTQRSEHDTGVWLSGLDAAAADMLSLEPYYRSPAVVCYLDRGAGAAIRRARTRLPGGGENPVAVVRIPRERMLGSGIASSLAHEVGHQAAAMLDLVRSLRSALHARQAMAGKQSVLQYWDRWISEIIADFWSVARIGVGSTLGLMNVVSLPKAFVFRINLDDPHPIPWIRVKLSCQMGKAIYPHPQWDRLARLWNWLYPTGSLAPDKQRLLSTLEAAIPEFVRVVLQHRPRKLRGRTLLQVMDSAQRQPAKLSSMFRQWSMAPEQMLRWSPSLVFAVIGQAKGDGLLTAGKENRILTRMLTHWALKARVDATPDGAMPAALAA
jgi:hypothetical protein